MRGRVVAAVGLAMLLPPLVGLCADKPFDPSRDPVQDLRATIKEAEAEHKNILLDVGGNWCPWCIVLDRFTQENPQLRQRLEHYVVLHVNFSRENQNKLFLSQYPRPSGFPHWYVLSPDGKLLVSEPTDVLEATHNIKDGYDAGRVGEFLDRWSALPASSGGS